MSRSHDSPRTFLTVTARGPTGYRASAGTVAGSVLATGRGGDTGRIRRTCVLLRAPGAIGITALTRTAAERTTDLRRSSQVVFAFPAIALRVAAAASAKRLLRATDITRTCTGEAAAGRGRAWSAVACAVTGLGGQGRTRAGGAANSPVGAVLAFADTIAHARRPTGRVRGRAGIVARLGCRNRKALSVGLPVQEFRACRAPGAILVAADAIGYHPGRALGA
jgi:hypothetical protein